MRKKRVLGVHCWKPHVHHLYDPRRLLAAICDFCFQSCQDFYDRTLKKQKYKKDRVQERIRTQTKRKTSVIDFESSEAENLCIYVLSFFYGLQIIHNNLQFLRRNVDLYMIWLRQTTTPDKGILALTCGNESLDLVSYWNRKDDIFLFR